MAITTGSQALAADVIALTQQVIVKNETRAHDAAAGDIAYTGYGFTPSVIIILASWESETPAEESQSVGAGDGTLEGNVYQSTDEKAACIFTGIVYIDAATPATATLKTLDADGFTLTWAQGSVNATINLVVIAIGQEAP